MRLPRSIHVPAFIPLSMATVAAAAVGLMACGGSEPDGQEYMSCSSYLKLSNEARQDAVVDVADTLNIELVTSGTVGERAQALQSARAKTDAQCRAAGPSQLDEAVVGANLDQPTSRPAQEAAPTTPEPSTKPSSDFEPDRTIVWGAKDSGAGSDGNGGDRSVDWLQSGATATVTVELGGVLKARPEAIPAGFSEVASVCTADPATDAVIPMRMTIRNTSEVVLNTVVDGWIDSPTGFSAPGMTIDAATKFADGEECQSHGGNTNYKWRQNDISPGQTTTHDWLLVVHNYYPPDYPDGHKVPLSKSLASFRLSATSSDGELPMNSTTCYSGPRATGIQPMDYRPSFSLNGDLSKLSERPMADHSAELEGVPECS